MTAHKVREHATCRLDGPPTPAPRRALPHARAPHGYTHTPLVPPLTRRPSPLLPSLSRVVAGGAVNATQLASACAPRSGLETLHLADTGTSDEDDDECGARRAAKAPREEGAFQFVGSLHALASAHPRTPRAAPLRSSRTPSKTPWLEPTSISFPFTADGGRRAVEASYVARLPCCPYTALDALHFRCASSCAAVCEPVLTHATVSTARTHDSCSSISSWPSPPGGASRTTPCTWHYASSTTTSAPSAAARMPSSAGC